MKALDSILKEKTYNQEASYNSQIGLMFLPECQSVFHRHPEFDEAFRRWTQSDCWRGMDFARLWSIVLNGKQTLARCPKGALAELGVYWGHSASVLALLAEQSGRPLYLCDTFSGFAQEQYDQTMDSHQKAAFKDTSLEAAKTIVGGYPGIRWIVGMFPDSMTSEMRQDTFAFVSIDCDIYEPIAQGLKFFWPRLEPGGLIFVQDYGSGHWPGATQAVDEFCAANGVTGCLLPDLSGTFVIGRGSAAGGR